MIRDVASLDTIKTLISQVNKNILQNVQSPVSIEVLNKLDLTKYLIKLGAKELIALSQNELALNTKYWAEVKTDEGGLVRLLNLAKKPGLLQSENTQSDNVLAQTLDFEKLKQAVDEYVKEPDKTTPQNNAKQADTPREETTKTADQKIEESKAKVENELKTAKDDAKELPKDDVKPQEQKSTTQKETKEATAEPKKQEIQKDGVKTPADEKRASSDAVQQKPEHEKLADKDSITAQVKNKAEPKEEKSVGDKDTKVGQETEKRAEKEAPKELPKPIQQKDNSDKPVEHKHQDAKESVKEDGRHEKSVDTKKEPETKDGAKPEIKDTAEKSQKTQNQEPQKKDILTTQRGEIPKEQTKDGAKETAGQPQQQKVQTKEYDKHEIKENPQKPEQKHMDQPLPDTFKSVVGGELAKEELQQLLMKKEQINTPDIKKEPIENKQPQEADPKTVKDIQEKAQQEEKTVGSVDTDEEKKNQANAVAEEALKQDETKPPADGPSSKIKSEILNEMTKSDNKEQFQIFSNLALNLNNNGFTMFVKGDDGKDGVLQFRKKPGGGVLTPKSVEFYSAFEHLGPIAGEIWQYNDKTYLSLDVEFESTMKALSQTLDDLEFFDKKNVTVKKGIVELFQVQNSFLNLLG